MEQPPISAMTVYILTYMLISIVAFFIRYYLLNVIQKPKLYTSNKKFEAFLTAHVPTLREKFKPCWYGWEGRIQTILGSLRPNQKIDYEREILSLRDGGQLALDFLEPLISEKSNRVSPPLVVFVLPGLTSTSQAAYIQSIVRSVHEVGAIVCVMNQRGLGGLELKTPRTNCPTKNEDVIDIIAYIKNKYPANKLVGVGCSLGGMQLLHYVTHHPKEAEKNLIAALVLSICWDSLGTMIKLESSNIDNCTFNASLTKNLQQIIKRHRPILEQRSDILNFDKILSCTTMREFDIHYTAPMFGYEDELDYYRDGHVKNGVPYFSIPVLALSALDDPMVRAVDLPIQEAQAEGSNLALLVTQHGGHLGFMESNGIFSSKPRFNYMERLVIDWLTAAQLYTDNLYNCRAESVKS